jgi:hypothetical protein
VYCARAVEPILGSILTLPGCLTRPQGVPHGTLVLLRVNYGIGLGEKRP